MGSVSLVHHHDMAEIIMERKLLAHILKVFSCIVRPASLFWVLICAVNRKCLSGIHTHVLLKKESEQNEHDQ